MPVVETLSAIIGIIGGFSTCANYVYKIVRKNKPTSRVSAQADGLHRTLTGGCCDIQRELLALRASRYSIADHYRKALALETTSLSS